MNGLHRLSAFGLEVESDFALPGTEPRGNRAPEADVALRLVKRAELEPLAGQARILSALHVFDGLPYARLEGPNGDVLIHFGRRRALFHLSADGRVLRCAPQVEDDPVWQRVLLDTVLWTVSLLRGFELLHASAVETPDGIVAFTAMSGGGKTSLAVECLRRGDAFYCDDILALEDADGEVTCHPGPPLMNLPRQLAPDAVGATRVIANFGDENWVQVGGPPPAARSLAAVVLVDRAAGHELGCAVVDGTSVTLLPHALAYPDVPERAKRRFELFGRVASTTPILRLTADPSVPTEALADVVQSRIGA